MARKQDRPIPFPKHTKGTQGLLHRKEANFLYTTPARLGDGLYGEIGTFRGRSAACVAGGIKDSGVKGHVISVDNYVYRRKGVDTDWDSSTIMQGVRENMEANGLGSYITLIDGASVEVAADYKDKEFVFIFIDADHSYEGCKADFEAWSPLVKSGGEVAFHDSNKEDVGRVIEEIGWEVVHTIRTLKVIKKP